MWIARNYTQKIIDAANARPVILLTGIRQAGKSSLLKRIFTGAEYITLDKLILAEEAELNPSSFLNRFEGQVIIDEIQYTPSLFRNLKIIVDENRKQKGKWILTGSQQFSLMQHVSESLAGRVSILNLGTLSASELNESGLLKYNGDLLWRGGFPEVWAENLNASDYFEDYVKTYLERDLKQIINVTNLRDFRRFLSLLAIRTGQLINYSEISKEIGVAVNTIKNWINALEVSGIIILLPPYYNNLGKRMIKAPKLYFCDNGLVSSLLNISSENGIRDSQYLGNLWENFVFTEFLKQGYLPGKNLFFYRDQNGVEIDFIIEKEGTVYLLEAKNNERPNPKKLNFHKIQPLFDHPVKAVIACRIPEKGLFDLAKYSLYNPLYGFNL